MPITLSERIQQDREIAQESRILKGEHWYSIYFIRKISIHISRLFARFGVPPNVITIVMGIAGLCGSLLMVYDKLIYNLCGIVFWHLWMLLDCVDGEVARLQKKTSVLGVYLDGLTHIIVNPTFILALGFHVYFKEPSLVNLFAMIIIYSAWHWKRGVHSLVTGTLPQKTRIDFSGTNRTSDKQAGPSSISWIRWILIHLMGDLDAALLISALIILSQVIVFEIAKWGLYCYTVLLLCLIAFVIVNNSRKIRNWDRRNTV